MGTRSAPLVFLLLAACMTTDGTQTVSETGSAPVQDPAVAAPVAPVSLPAIPRMRPKPPRKQQSARAAPTPAVKPSPSAAAKPAARAGAVAADDAAAAPASRAAGAVTDTAGSTASAHPAADAAPDRNSPLPPDLAAGDASPTAADAAGGAETGLPPAVDSTSGPAAALAEPDVPPAGFEDGSVDGDDGADDGFDVESGTALESELAALVLPEINPGIDVESLFDGDVVRYCAAMWQMGEYIGVARRRGEPFRQAIDDAVRRIAVEKSLPLDNRLAFSGQVYGRLVYRLEDSHAALTLGTYVHFACLTVRGDKKIVPADPNAERLLNAGLMRCENTAFTRDDLNDCIFRELTPIVDRRND